MKKLLALLLTSAPLLAQQHIPVSNLLIKNGTAAPILVLGSGAAKVTLSAGTGGVLKVDGIALGAGTGGGGGLVMGGTEGQVLYNAGGTIGGLASSGTGAVVRATGTAAVASSVPLAGITGIGAGGTAALALATNATGGLVTAGSATTVTIGNLTLGTASTFTGNVSATTFDGVVFNLGGNQSPLNVAIGSNALVSTMVGGWNVAIGDSALKQHVTGGNNVVIGADAMKNSTSSEQNIAIGRDARSTATAGDYNISIGGESLKAVSGVRNTAIGYRSGYAANSTVNNVVLLGSFAGSRTSASGVLVIDGYGDQRLSESAEQTRAIIYGKMTAAGEDSQELRINAGTLKFPHLPTSNNGFVWNNGGVLITGTPGTPTLNISGNATTSTTSGTASVATVALNSTGSAATVPASGVTGQAAGWSIAGGSLGNVALNGTITGGTAALTLANGTATLTPPTVVGSTGQVLTLLTTGGQTSWQSVAAGGTASSGSVLAPAITSSSLLSFGTGASLALGTSGIITDGAVGTITGSSGQLTITNGYIFQGTAASLKMTGGQILEGYGFTNNGNISNAGIISGGTISPAVFGLGTTNNITLVGTMSGGTASGRHIATSTANGLVLTGTNNILGSLSFGTNGTITGTGASISIGSAGATNVVSLPSTLNATSPTVGAATFTGGIAVAKDIYTGGNITANSGAGQVDCYTVRAYNGGLSLTTNLTGITNGYYANGNVKAFATSMPLNDASAGYVQIANGTPSASISVLGSFANYGLNIIGKGSAGQVNFNSGGFVMSGTSATVATGSSGLWINVAIGTAATTSGWRLGLGTDGSLQAIGTAGVLKTLAP